MNMTCGLASPSVAKTLGMADSLVTTDWSGGGPTSDMVDSLVAAASPGGATPSDVADSLEAATSPIRAKTCLQGAVIAKTYVGIVLTTNAGIGPNGPMTTLASSKSKKQYKKQGFLNIRYKKPYKNKDF